MPDAFVLPTTKAALEEELLHWRGKADRLSNKVSRWADENKDMVATVNSYVASTVTAGVSAGATGWLETRFPNKDGTLLSLGPIPLPLVSAALGLGASFMFENPVAKTQSLGVVAGNVGLWSGTMGRGYGSAARAKKLKAEGATEGEIGAGATIHHLPVGAANQGQAWSEKERAVLGL